MWECVSQLLTFAQLFCSVTDADGDVGGVVELLTLSPIFDVDGLQLLRSLRLSDGVPVGFW